MSQTETENSEKHNIPDAGNPPAETDKAQNALAATDEDEAFGYGERTCLECGKKFIALHFAQICCSEECRKLRRKNKNRANVMRHVNRLRSRIVELEKRNAELEAELAEALARLAETSAIA